MLGARSGGVAAGQLGSLFSLGAAGALTDGQLLERFLTREDPAAAEAAFTALVDRHGPMVLSVCRRELGDLHDAHDAFQATFLVLVSKAGSIRHRETVGGWLFGIARRVAARARADGARRRRHLEQFGLERNLSETGCIAAAPAGPDLDYTPLIDEVDRLPERFRAPVVLHYFEGLSTEATAQRLGCARGTVLSRLARARDRLRRRLEQRGLAPGLLIPTGDALTRWLPAELVPAGLAHRTIRAASSLGLAGAVIESVVPATVASLSRRVARALALSRVSAAAAFFLVAAVGVSIGLAATLQQESKPQRGAAMQKPQARAEKRQTPDSDQGTKSEHLVLRGQVVDPDGKPVPGAEIMLSVAGPVLIRDPRRLGASGPDGRFEVNVPRDRLEPPPGTPQTPFGSALAALSPGFGPDWSVIDTKKADEPIHLRLRRDDVPIEGRVFSLEGRPVPGLSVKVAYIGEVPPDVMTKLRENAGRMNPELWGELRNDFQPGDKGAFRPVQTGADGRFRITGIGRDRVAVLIVEGGAIEQSLAMVLTSGDPGYKPVLLPGDGSGGQKIEPPRFEMAVAPGRVVEGTVRDRDTDRPVPGATIRNWLGANLECDAQGRFRIAGQPKGRENVLTVTVGDQPYIKVVKPFNDPRGIEPVHLDIPVKRGVWVEGKVTNRATGQPVKAVVVYYPFSDNMNLKDCADASFLNNNVSDEAEYPTDASGRFRAAVLPGRGLLAVKAAEPGFLNAEPLDGRTAGNVLYAPGVDFAYYMYPYHALVPIEAPAAKTLVLPDIPLAPGRTQHIRIVDPAGKPVAGCKVLCLQEASLSGDEVTFWNGHPGKAESIIVSQPDRSLGARVDLKGDEPDPIRLVLQRTGSVTGRLVDEDGRPRRDVDLSVHQRFLSRGGDMGTDRFAQLTTGSDGRFRFQNFVPGVAYTIEAIKRGERNYSFRAEGYVHRNHWRIKPGESLDWGDVQVKPYPR
jgi:RNA polymerase sigma factor (sigma-70 family)